MKRGNSPLSFSMDNVNCICPVKHLSPIMQYILKCVSFKKNSEDIKKY